MTMDNEKDMEAKRAEAVEELRAAFAELESGEIATKPCASSRSRTRMFPPGKSQSIWTEEVMSF